MKEPKKLLVRILDCIDFQEDKDEYANFLLSMIFEDAIDEALRKMPAARRKSIAHKFRANRANPAALKSLIEHNISEKEFSEAAESAAEKAITAILNRVTQDITPIQRQQLSILFQEFGRSL